MDKYGAEKRKFNRVPFSYNDNILGKFTHPVINDKIIAHILNLSLKGLYFTMKKEDSKSAKEGDTLIFLELKGPRQQDFIVSIDMEIKRVLDYAELEHFGYGCEFQSLPDSSKEQIKRFLEMWFLEGRS
jgi:hypothetical protein